MYRSLKAEQIMDTTKNIVDKIIMRFPDSGLGKVSAEVLEVSNESIELTRWVSKPIVWVRVCTSLLMISLIVLMAEALHKLHILNLIQNFSYEFGNFLQATESGVNDVAFIGIAIFFLVTFENRIKRKKILKAINELRSLAHVIDAHQINKDPKCCKNSSTRRVMNTSDVSQYLDFCSDLLSMIGKLAALYVQKFHDSESLKAVDDIQDLTNGLSRKIWQKIALINQGGITDGI